jgi:hypothetical protein
MNDLSTIARTPVEMLAPVIEKIDRPHKKSHFFADVAPVELAKNGKSTLVTCPKVYSAFRIDE